MSTVVTNNWLLNLVLRALWLPRGQSTSYYRDVALGVIFAAAGVATLVFSLTGQTSRWAFWITVCVAVICLIAARNRLAIIAAALLFVASRFLITFLLSGEISVLLLGVIAAAVAFAILWAATRNDVGTERNQE